MVRQIKCTKCDNIYQRYNRKKEECDRCNSNPGYMYATIENIFETYKNSLQKCDICDNTIPKNIKRISFEEVVFNKKVKFRLCPICLKKCYGNMDYKSKEFKRWEKELAIKKM